VSDMFNFLRVVSQNGDKFPPLEFGRARILQNMDKFYSMSARAKQQQKKVDVFE